MLKYGTRRSPLRGNSPVYHLCMADGIALCGVGSWPGYLSLRLHKTRPKRRLCKTCQLSLSAAKRDVDEARAAVAAAEWNLKMVEQNLKNYEEHLADID